MNWVVPLSDIKFGTEEKAAVQSVLDSGWLTMGEVTRTFEEAFSLYTSAKYCFAVSNATVALHMACLACGIKPGDEVIVYWDGAEYDYRVRETFTVEPDDETVLVRDGEDRLTLYTCRPRFLGDTRTVVVAEPVTR